MPEMGGLGFFMQAFVDADHAGNTITRRSRIGFLVYVNMAHIYWLSRKQSSIETSLFSLKYCAMKQCTEYDFRLCLKLRMTGIPCKEPMYIYMFMGTISQFL